MYGREHKGQLKKTGDKTVSIEFDKAYKNPALEKATRTVTLDNNVLTLDDAFQFAASGMSMPVEEAFMTWQKVEVNGNTARIIADNGTVEIQAAEGTFTAEPLEEACKANHKSGMLTRIAIRYPQAWKPTTHFTITYQPTR